MSKDPEATPRKRTPCTGSLCNRTHVRSETCPARHVPALSRLQGNQRLSNLGRIGLSSMDSPNAKPPASFVPVGPTRLVARTRSRRSTTVKAEVTNRQDAATIGAPRRLPPASRSFAHGWRLTVLRRRDETSPGQSSDPGCRLSDQHAHLRTRLPARPSTLELR